MSFLQPAILLALPVIALPIVIHLINQRRFQTFPWAAMQFLLAANRMSRGYAKLRQWLILAARTLAIAGLVFAISRPLSSGWLAVAGGGRVDTTIILLDRSPSMTQRSALGISKLQAGVDQLSQSLGLLRSGRYVLVDSVGAKTIEIESPELLADLPETAAASASADIPTMLEAAEQYIRANRPSRCEVWICSDLRRHDWKDESGRWEAIGQSLRKLSQSVRFRLLAYPDQEPQQRSLRVTGVRRVEGTEGTQLLLSLRVEQSEPAVTGQSIPIRLELDGARSEFTAEIVGTELELSDYSVPIDRGQTRGWGRVSIPSDSSPADNEYFFVYDRELPRRTVIVTDEPANVRPLEFAAGVSPEAGVTCSAEIVMPEQLLGTSLDDAGLLLWQAPLPQPDDPEFSIVQGLVQRGGRVIALPPTTPGDGELAALRWGQWKEGPAIPVATWVGDQDLLAKTRSGAALPVGELTVSRYCELQGDRTALATLEGGPALLARAMTDRHNVYFLSTTTAPNDSSLARSGVVLYAMIHRALAAGALSLGNTRQAIAGQLPDQDSSGWTRLAGNPAALSNAFAFHAGVYQHDDQLLAINRDELEDAAATVSDEQVSRLFAELDFDRLDQRPGSGSALVREIWRLFLIAMLLALVVEAGLCMPRPQVQNQRAGRGGLAA
jgi:hypothetical protein